jgi:hypothetical protein
VARPDHSRDDRPGNHHRTGHARGPRQDTGVHRGHALKPGAISLKTRYHRDRQHQWTANDINDIDALAIAVPYCDAVFTDKAARNTLAVSRELRPFGTFLPRKPGELAEWLDNPAG